MVCSAKSGGYRELKDGLDRYQTRKETAPKKQKKKQSTTKISGGLAAAPCVNLCK